MISDKGLIAEKLVDKNKTKMTRNLLFLSLLLFPLFAFGQKDDDFKVITYNIWNGFDFGKDAIRRGKLQAWMSNQKPDVVALQELCAYTPEKLKEDAASWGHAFSVLMKTTGYSVGITSKFPITLVEKITEGMHHGALHCKVNGIDFLVVHLNPGSYKKRRVEADILCRKEQEISKANSKTIILGDFNAHSPFDADLYDPNGYFLTRLRKSNEEKGDEGNVEHNDLDYAVMSAFLANPLYDVIRKYTTGIKERGSFPTHALEKINNETIAQLDSRKEHIDFIMVSSELYSKCKTAKVLNGEDTSMLSDHYPAMAIFNLSEKN